ncbi:transcriptional regulator with XRE-family HTH domain [Anaerotaenia torta]|uniref:helix-turn-helix domain-containing protein n=1 Tax=Anaerotaenia torta TaxID=433293 RepID=UPI003D249F70
MDREKIGKLIAERRKARNYTQAELAVRLGVTDKSVSKWECGRSMPDASLYEPLCRELDISISELLAGEKSDGTNEQRINNETILEIVRLYEKTKHHKDILIGVAITVIGSLLPMDMGAVSEVGEFIQGCSLGLSVGMKVVGLIWIMYGIAKSSRDR